MRGIFVDTNIFLRHLTNDEPVHSAAARELIRSIEQGTVTAWTTPVALAEVVFVLQDPKTYHVSRLQMRDLILPLLSLSNLKVEHKRLYPRVFDLYISLGIDFVDAYHATLLAHYQQLELYSFDTDFDKVPGIKCREPAQP